MSRPVLALQFPQVRHRAWPSRALIGTCSSVTVLPEDAWSRVKPVRQIGQAVLPRSYRRTRLLLPVFRDISGNTGWSPACSRACGWLPADKPSIRQHSNWTTQWMPISLSVQLRRGARASHRCVRDAAGHVSSVEDELANSLELDPEAGGPILTASDGTRARRIWPSCLSPPPAMPVWRPVVPSVFASLTLERCDHPSVRHAPS